MSTDINIQYWCEFVHYYGKNELTCLCGSETVPRWYLLIECGSGVDVFLLDLTSDDECSSKAGLELFWLYWGSAGEPLLTLSMLPEVNQVTSGNN